MNECLYIVVPCYNEEEVLPISSKIFINKLTTLIAEKTISTRSKIVFVDDGSTDNTWTIIKELVRVENCCSGIKLSRNRGHQNALLAGLMTVKSEADIVISIDSDLQDDINAIDLMIDKYQEGYEIVCGVRSSREEDSIIKRITAQGFYKFMSLLGVEVQYNHADFRLMSRKALDALGEFKEVNIFLRGIIPMVGFRSCSVEYSRKKRLAGESKYPLKKMLSFAFEGITSLSIKPVRVITMLGFFMLIASILFVIYTIIGFAVGNTVAGWVSTVLSIWFFGSLQLIAIGVVGEYIGKIYLETKSRPRYIVEEYLCKQVTESDNPEGLH